MKRLLPLICLAFLHTLVDTSALLIEPLWPELEVSFGLIGVAALSTAFIVQSIPTSLSQVVFGYARDISSLPSLIWAGPLFAVLCLTAIGFAPNTWSLYLLLLVGGIGVGAFHPEAAVAAGRIYPESRTRSMAVFMFGGSLGLALGPFLSGMIVSNFGLQGLIYLLPVMLLIIPFLWWGSRVPQTEQASSTVPESAAKRLSVSEMLGGRIGMALLLLAICSLRLVPNMAMAKVISFSVQHRGGNAADAGMMQSIFLVSASVGMCLIAFCFRQGWERAFMIGCPLIGIPLLLLLGTGWLEGWGFVAVLIPTGFVLWGTTPTMVSFAQQLFPKGAGLASAITMGFSWGIGGLIQAPITAYFSSTPFPEHALQFFTPFLLFSAAGAALLPTTESLLHSTAPQQSDNQPQLAISEAK